MRLINFNETKIKNHANSIQHFLQSKQILPQLFSNNKKYIYRTVRTKKKLFEVED